MLANYAGLYWQLSGADATQEAAGLLLDRYVEGVDENIRGVKSLEITYKTTRLL